MTISKKLIKQMNKHFGTEYIKDNTPPEGWTEEAKEGASQAAAIGLSLDDLDDGGDMAAEFNEIMDLNSDLYKK
jgi:hypothetical protein